MPPEISVAVINWNRRDYLRACLESLTHQRSVDFEVIVVDNGSRDGSLEMIREEFATRPGFRISVIANTVNRGFCAANNQVFAAARGSFVALLNNDAEAEPDFLAALRGAFDAAPVGEITILQGTYQMSLNWAFWAVVGIALGAAYLLWLFQRTMLGEVSEKNARLRDLSMREVAVFAPLVAWAFWIGLNPQPFFRVLDRPVAQIVERVRPGYYAEHHLANPLDNAGTTSAR